MATSQRDVRSHERARRGLSAFGVKQSFASRQKHETIRFATGLKKPSCVIAQTAKKGLTELGHPYGRHKSRMTGEIFMQT